MDQSWVLYFFWFVVVVVFKWHRLPMAFKYPPLSGCCNPDLTDTKERK